MALETAQYIHQLNPSFPSGADRLKDGDDHIRLIKAALKATFPGVTGPFPVGFTQDFVAAFTSQLVPAGSIIMFTGSTAPEGWAICDGRTVPKLDGTGNLVTPDFRNRVPIGAANTAVLGDLLGQASRTVTTEAGGAHGHTAISGPAGAHSHTLQGTTGTATTGASIATTITRLENEQRQGNALLTATLADPGHSHSLSGGATNEAGGHAHTVSVADAPGHSHSVSVDVTQPSLALNFIIKL